MLLAVLTPISEQDMRYFAPGGRGGVGARTARLIAPGSFSCVLPSGKKRADGILLIIFKFTWPFSVMEGFLSSSVTHDVLGP